MFYKNLPNYLTIIRIAFIPIIIASFYYADSRIARLIGSSLFVAAGLTDFLDGYIARKWKVTSKFGKAFDPIADKLLVACVILMLAKYGRADVVPCLLILAREFFVSGIREFLAGIKVKVPVSKLAKVKTFMQMSSLALLIVGSKGLSIEWVDSFGQITLWLAAGFTLVTGFSYFTVFYRRL